MKIYPFSSAGVQQWQSDLYAQPDPVQQEEAQSVAAGLTSWLPARFDLTADQVAFLNSGDPSLLHVWSVEVAYAITKHIPIVLNKPDSPPPVGVRNTKLVLTEEELKWLEENSKQEGDKGKLTFTITY